MQYMSDERKIESGIIQGSTLGPLPFIIYINDPVPITNDIRAVPLDYADDKNLITISSPVSSLQSNICILLNIVNEWCIRNASILNTEKTEYMIFTTDKSSLDPKDFRFD